MLGNALTVLEKASTKTVGRCLQSGLDCAILGSVRGAWERASLDDVGGDTPQRVAQTCERV